MLRSVCIAFRFLLGETVSIQRECMLRIQGESPRWTESDRELYNLYIFLEDFVHHWKMGRGITSKDWRYLIKYPSSILNFYDGRTLSSEQLDQFSKRSFESSNNSTSI